MSVIVNPPAPYPEINALLQELLDSVQSILGSHFIGMYLDGSLASGDFDPDSDVDFVVVTDEEIRGDLFSALAAMHERIAARDSSWAIQLEGSYLSQQALQRYDPARALHPNIERGSGERLKMVHHDEGWMTHRYILRERGITLAGPCPLTLIDPVSPTQLRQAMLPVLNGWAAQLLQDPAPLKHCGSQPYTVLTLCRILFTLQYGTVVSKPVAARWAQDTLGERWAPLIERAWAGRHDGGPEASSEDLNGTLEFIRYTQEKAMADAPPRRQPIVVPAGTGPFFDLGDHRGHGKMSARSTGGAFTLFEMTADPGGHVSPHVHTREDETFYILEGRFSFRIGEQTLESGPGDTVFAPRSLAHAWRCVGPGPGTALVLITPGDNFEAFSIEMAQRGMTPSAAMAEPALAAEFVALAQRYGITMLPPAE